MRRPAHRGWSAEPRRGPALLLVAIIHIALGFALLKGLGVDVTRPAEVVTRIVDISIPPPPPPLVEVTPKEVAKSKPAAAAVALPAPKGGPKGPVKVKQVQPDATRVPYPVPNPVALAGGGKGSGTAVGAGAGGGTGGNGNGDGDGDGGNDAELIAGNIGDRDYPKDLGRQGLGGRVVAEFDIDAGGRVHNCRVSRSSRVPELDDLTCRLVTARLRFRPATDRSGRPIASDGEYEMDWIPPR